MSTMNCQNCSVSYGPDDMFCENCGYDFITGSLPVDADSGPMAAAPPVAPSVLDPSGGSAAAATGSSSDDGGGAAAASSDPSSGAAGGGGTTDVPRLRLSIAVDRPFFDEMVNDGEIDFPNPAPAVQILELAGAELHIGRTSDGRAIHPDIDVSELTGDQAVSSRHAVLRVGDDGGYTIVDVGSTNGTFLETVDSEAIDHGVPVEVKVGMPIFVGAWTRLTITE